MKSLKFKIMASVGIVFATAMLMGAGGPKPKKGLNSDAAGELSIVGVDKYLGEFTPVSSTDVGDGWTKHTFDTDGGDGPICIAGTEFSAFSREGNPSRLLLPPRSK